MGKRKRNGRRGGSGRTLGVRRATGGAGWVLVHPRCARDRAEDLEEVREMIAAGEQQIAVDELRWLLEGCSDFLEAHQLLGELAYHLDGDVALARAHFGVAYQLGERALQKAGQPRPLPYREPANRPLFECGRSLAACLAQLGNSDMAERVLRTLLDCDPTDPLHLAGALDDLKLGGLPIVEL